MDTSRGSRTFLEQQVSDLQDSMGRVNRARLMSFLGGISLMLLLILSSSVLLPLLSSGQPLMRALIGIDLAFFVSLAFLLSAFVPLTLRKVVVEFNRKVAEDRKAQKAEQEVRNVLANLDERQYAVFHGLYRRYGDIDHVVIGPTGAFIIETKSNHGNVSVDERGRLEIDQGGQPRKNYQRQARQEAYQVRDYLTEHGIPEQLFVQSILAFPFAGVPEGLYLGTTNTGSYIPIVSGKGVLQYIYQHRASALFTPDLVGRCRDVLQCWADGTDLDLNEAGA
ncbi:nuclease-related domain-containing protein [Candidatus Cryosericum terrychapinii]|uniref:NERD domain-containing protein n=1 Tax=Candidatus Cryosericum terrychapinii TaxID=2290919 RepID=A0A398D384_9BACT|nr:nuclease-related domain-containing protein [Candidatus Cryosericum terrychapinii]RIE05921.1 NERD domain-containing protein [Candidatus Cryosericum terrychapinii]